MSFLLSKPKKPIKPSYPIREIQDTISVSISGNIGEIFESISGEYERITGLEFSYSQLMDVDIDSSEYESSSSYSFKRNLNDKEFKRLLDRYNKNLENYKIEYDLYKEQLRIYNKYKEKIKEVQEAIEGEKIDIKYEKENK